jgi:hypothetical protein
MRGASRVEWPVRIRKARNNAGRAREAKPFGKRPCGRSAVSLVARVE